MGKTLPRLALSVRQPWAWAILHAGKDIENRSVGAIRAGRMGPGRIALHAASGMTQAEYDWAVWRMAQDGIRVPTPDALPRRAIVGAVDVLEVVTEADSIWFGGRAGLRLAGPSPCPPIPAAGALGYFEWRSSGALAPLAGWMQRRGRPGGDAGTGMLFDDLEPGFRTPPRKPFGPAN